MFHAACAYFAAGCFWTVEHLFAAQPGVVGTRTGFTGGTVPDPTYEQVCHKQTGHVEAVEVRYDPAQTSFEALARFFFEMHDPTRDRRANGGQYRSAIFYTTPEQRDTALALLRVLRQNGYEAVTEVRPAGAFYPAADRHQHYYCRLERQPTLRQRVARFANRKS